MRWSRLCANAAVCLFAAIMPALAAMPLSLADLRAAPMPPSFIAPMPPLFDTQEIFHGDTAPFKQWTDMRGRMNEEYATAPPSCGSRQPECEMDEWSQLVVTVAPLPLRDKLDRVNLALNAVPYVPSARNWRRAAYWETPLEFLAYGGQCQDYAIAKYMLLREAGVPADQMRIVVLRATALDEDHAVLVVDVDGEALMLDDKRTGVVPASAETSYRPYYSINELGWWQHVAVETIALAQHPAGAPSSSTFADSLETAAPSALAGLRKVGRLIDSIPLPFAEPSS